MNGIKFVPLARKYARAFCNVYPDVCKEKDILAMLSLSNELRSRRTIFFYLKLSLLDDEVKVSAISQMARQWRVAKICQRILELLARHKRLFLFPDVLESVANICLQRLGIVRVAIVSSHELDESILRKIVDHLEAVLSQKVIYNTSVDSRLIAGIKISTGDKIWQKSIAKIIQYLRARWGQQYGI